MKYNYQIKYVDELKLQEQLDLFGEDGYELVSTIPMQRMKPLTQPPQMEFKFLLIFKKPCQA